MALSGELNIFLVYLGQTQLVANQEQEAWWYMHGFQVQRHQRKQCGQWQLVNTSFTWTRNRWRWKNLKMLIWVRILCNNFLVVLSLDLCMHNLFEQVFFLGIFLCVLGQDYVTQNTERHGTWVVAVNGFSSFFHVRQPEYQKWSVSQCLQPQYEWR